METGPAYLRITPKVARVTCILLLLSGCQWLTPEYARRSPVNANGDSLNAYNRLERENARLRERATALKLEMSGKDAELVRVVEAYSFLSEELRVAHKDIAYVERQFVNIELRLTREETRAPAVAAIAEAQLLFERLDADDDTRPDAETIEAYNARMKTAEDQIDKPNYSAAVYYARRAMRILNRMERFRNSSSSYGEKRVIAVSKANLRAGPGTSFDVLERLAYGTPLVELRRNGGWVKVRSQSGRTGWIHDDLIR